MMRNDPIVIVGAARTPMGGFQGDFTAAAPTSAASPSGPRSSGPASSPRTSTR